MANAAAWAHGAVRLAEAEAALHSIVINGGVARMRHGDKSVECAERRYAPRLYRRIARQARSVWPRFRAAGELLMASLLGPDGSPVKPPALRSASRILAAGYAGALGHRSDLAQWRPPLWSAQRALSADPPVLAARIHYPCIVPTDRGFILTRCGRQ